MRFGLEAWQPVFDMKVFLVRFAAFLLIAAAVAIATVPILVLIDLLGDGTGWGLCPGGLDACDRPYSAGAELLVILTVGLLAAVAGIRILMRIARRLKDDTYQVVQ